MKVTIDGRTQSIKNWCKEYHVPGRTVRDRVKKGYSLEDAIKGNVNLNYHNCGRKVDIVHTETLTLKEWSQLTGISYSWLYKSIKAGKTIKEIASKYNKEHGDKIKASKAESNFSGLDWR